MGIGSAVEGLSFLGASAIIGPGAAASTEIAPTFLASLAACIFRSADASGAVRHVDSTPLERSTSTMTSGYALGSYARRILISEDSVIRKYEESYLWRGILAVEKSRQTIRPFA
jgi:hypothetical protein